MSEVILERYRHDLWGGRQQALKALNARIADLHEQGYACESFPGEYTENGEVKPCEVLRAVRFSSKPDDVRPEDA